MYPNIRVLLIIGCTRPVSSAEAEHSFPGLRWIKSYLGNSISDKRLSGLALMHLIMTLTLMLTKSVIFCTQTQQEDVPRVHPLRVEFKWTASGQEYNVKPRLVGGSVGGMGEKEVASKRQTVLSEPKFRPPNQNFLDLPLKTMDSLEA